MSAGLHDELRLPHQREFELYHNSFSLGSEQVRLALAELGIEALAHEVALIETGAYENLNRQFLAVNPAGLVPVLVHAGRPIYESAAILRFAAQHAPPGAPPLIPRDPALAAQMQPWLERASLHGDDPLADAEHSAASAVLGSRCRSASRCSSRCRTRASPRACSSGARRRADQLPAAERCGLARFQRVGPAMRAFRRCAEHLKQHLDALEGRLCGGGPWILGDAFGLADLCWAAIFERLREIDALELFVGLASRAGGVLEAALRAPQSSRRSGGPRARVGADRARAAASRQARRRRAARGARGAVSLRPEPVSFEFACPLPALRSRWSADAATEDPPMAWDFETDPEFQEKLDWVDALRARGGRAARPRARRPVRQERRAGAGHRPAAPAAGEGPGPLGRPPRPRARRPGLRPGEAGAAERDPRPQPAGRRRSSAARRPTRGNAEILAHYGTDEQKAQVPPAAARRRRSRPATR